MFLVIFLIGASVVLALMGMVLYAVVTGETPTPHRIVTGLSRRFRIQHRAGKVVYTETSGSSAEAPRVNEGATKRLPATTFRM